MAICRFEEGIASCERIDIYDQNDHITARGFFSDIRVDRRTLPDGWHAYDFRSGDDGEWLGTLEENYVYVNHAGTLLTMDTIRFPHSYTYENGTVTHWANMKSLPDEESEKWDFNYSFM